MTRLYLFLASLIAGLGATADATAQVHLRPLRGVHIQTPFLSFQTGSYASFGHGYDALYWGRPSMYDRYPYRSFYRYGIAPLPVIPLPPLPAYPPAFELDPLYHSDDPYASGYRSRHHYVYPEPFSEHDTYPSAHPPLPADPGYSGEAEWIQPQVDPWELADETTIRLQLRSAALRLSRALSLRRDDADVWLDYLDPDRIVATIDQEQSPLQLQSLLLNYEALTGNSRLSEIWLVDGFRQTHRLLDEWIERAAPEPSLPMEQLPEPEQIPAPEKMTPL